MLTNIFSILLIYSLQKLVEQMYQSITLPDKHDCCTCTCWETYLCQLVFTKTRALHCVITRDAASQQNVSGFGWNYIPWKIGKKSMYLHLFESIDTKDKRARRLLLLRTSTLNNKLNIHIRPHRKKPKCYKRESTWCRCKKKLAFTSAYILVFRQGEFINL